MASAVLSRPRMLVIGYHRVVDDFDAAAKTDMPTMLVTRAMFERHVDWIGRRFDFVGLDEIGKRCSSAEPFPGPVAAITFDDGYSDVYEHAFPVLVRKGIPAALFVVTDLVGRSCWQLHDRLYHLLKKAYERWNDPQIGLTRILAEANIPVDEIAGLKRVSKNPYFAVSGLLPLLSANDARRLIERLTAQAGNGLASAPRTLTWPMIAEMSRAGFTIGSHTKSHVWLANESDERVLDEVAGSKAELERRLGNPVAHFAYPGGQFTRPVVEAVKRAGYQYGYTACDHRDPRFPSLTIRRLLLWEKSSIDADDRFSSAILDCQTHSLWPPSRGCARVHET
jgi:peptidoglycan/xylan/chitin deacetylase (PgdA/CDA1 family)